MQKYKIYCNGSCEYEIGYQDDSYQDWADDYSDGLGGDYLQEYAEDVFRKESKLSTNDYVMLTGFNGKDWVVVNEYQVSDSLQELKASVDAYGERVAELQKTVNQLLTNGE